MKRIERDYMVVSYDDEANTEFRYKLVMDDDPESTTWFRYDDGWRYLPDGERTTVDREYLVGQALIDEWDREGWVPAEAWALLDELRSQHG